jgi:WhiB family transcriptional regulator, redox-sensing transcriptional regulator
MSIQVALGAEFTSQIRGDEMEWQLKGICNYVDPEIFFPNNNNMHVNRLPKQICLDCPVIATCRDWGLTKGEHYGVWGGLSYSDRRRIWKKQKQSSR